MKKLLFAICFRNIVFAYIVYGDALRLIDDLLKACVELTIVGNMLDELHGKLQTQQP